jgi:hypothetical protein
MKNGFLTVLFPKRKVKCLGKAKFAKGELKNG